MLRDAIYGSGGLQVYPEIKANIGAGTAHDLKQIYLAGAGGGQALLTIILREVTTRPVPALCQTLSHMPRAAGLLRGRAGSIGLWSLFSSSMLPAS